MISKGVRHGSNHRVDAEDSRPVDRAAAVAAVAPVAGRLTIEEAAAIYQFTPSALYEFIRRRPWLPGVLRFGRSIRIDQARFEAGLKQLQLRRRPMRRTA